MQILGNDYSQVPTKPAGPNKRVGWIFCITLIAELYQMILNFDPFLSDIDVKFSIS